MSFFCFMWGGGKGMGTGVGAGRGGGGGGGKAEMVEDEHDKHGSVDVIGLG